MIEIKNDLSLFEGFEQEPTKDKEKEEKVAIPGVNLTSNESLADQWSKDILGEESPKEDDDKPVDKKEDSKDSELEDKNKDKSEDNTEEETKKEIEVDDEDESSYSFKGLVEYLNGQGVIDFKDFDDLDDSPEILDVAITKSIQEGVEKHVTEYKESLPEVVAELVEFIERGGDPEKFIDAITKPIDFDTLNLDTEINQELVVREYLKSIDYSKEEIDEAIESYKDGVILDKQAKVAAKKLEKIYDNRKEDLVREQEEYIAEQQRKAEEQIDTIKKSIKSASEIAGLKLSEKDKEEFTDYFLKKNPKSGLSKYQEELSQDYVKNAIDLAYLKFKKYDFSKVKEAAKTEATKEIKNKIFTKTDKTVKGKSADVDKGSNRFEAFKKQFGRV